MVNLEPQREDFDLLRHDCPTCGRTPDLTWTNLVRLLDQEREEFEDELAFDAWITGDTSQRDSLRALIYDRLAPKVPKSPTRRRLVVTG